MKSYRAMVFPGSSLVATVEDVRSFLDNNHEVFLNRVQYFTHGTRGPNKWAPKTIELDRDYSGPQDMEAEVSFMPKAKPVRKLKPISLSEPQSPSKTNISVPIAGGTVDLNVMQSIDSLGSGSEAAPTVPSSSGANNITSRAPVPSLEPVKPPLGKIRVKGSAGRQIVDGAVKEHKRDPPAVAPSPWASSRRVPAVDAEPSTVTMSTVDTEDPQKIALARHRAQERVLRKLVEDKKAVEDREQAQMAAMQQRLEKNEMKVRAMQEKTMQRVDDYWAGVQRREEEERQRRADDQARAVEDRQKVVQKDYEDKVKDMRVDAQRRMKRFHERQVRQVSEEEERNRRELAKLRATKDPNTTFKVKKRHNMVYVHNVDDAEDVREEEVVVEHGRVHALRSPRPRIVPTDLDQLEAPHSTRGAAPNPPIDLVNSQDEPGDEDSLYAYIQRNESGDIERFVSEDAGGKLSPAVRPNTISTSTSTAAAGSGKAFPRYAFNSSAQPSADALHHTESDSQRAASLPSPQLLSHISPVPRRRAEPSPDALFGTQHVSPLDRLVSEGGCGRGGGASSSSSGDERHYGPRGDTAPRSRSNSTSSDMSDLTVEGHYHRRRSPRKPNPPAGGSTKRPQPTLHSQPEQLFHKISLPVLPTIEKAIASEVVSKVKPSPIATVPAGMGTVASDSAHSRGTQKKKRAFKRLAPIPIASYNPLPSQS